MIFLDDFFMGSFIRLSTRSNGTALSETSFQRRRESMFCLAMDRHFREDDRLKLLTFMLYKQLLLSISKKHLLPDSCTFFPYLALDELPIAMATEMRFTLVFRHCSLSNCITLSLIIRFQIVTLAIHFGHR